MSYSYSIQGGPAPAFPPREFMQQQQHQQSRRKRQSQQQQQQPQQQQQQYSNPDPYDQYDKYNRFNDYQQDYLPQQQRYSQTRGSSIPQSNTHPPIRSANHYSHRPTSSVYSQTNSIDLGSHNQQLPPPQHTQQYQSQYANQARQTPPPPSKQQYSQHHPQPSYEYTDPRAQYLKYSKPQNQANADGVSPESSPELSATAHLYGNHSSNRSQPQNQYSTPYYREPSPFDMSATQAVPPMDSAADGRPPSASRTNIPSMRRERRQTQDAASRTLRETKSRERLQQMQERTSSMSSATSKRGYKGGEVRWDPRTGELTSSQKGRPSQVKPIEFVRGLATDIVPPSPTESVHKDPASEVASFASRLRKTSRSAGSDKTVPPIPDQPIPVTLKPVTATAAPSSLPVAAPVSPARASSPLHDSTDPAAGAFTSSRPAWNGASGRTTLVAPVHDTPDVAPLNIPRRSSKRVGSVPQLQKAMNAAKAAANASSAANPSSPSQISGSLVSPPVSPSPQGVETQDQQASNLHQATAASGQISAQTNKSFASPASASGSTAHSYPSPPLQDDQFSSKIRRKPTPSHQALASFDASDPFNYNNRANPRIAASPPELRPPLHESSEWTQPASRFSVTTYNSTIPESAYEFDPSDAPEMPPIPDPLRSSPPFMIKRRPTTAQTDSSFISEQRTSPPRQKPAPINTKPLPDLGEGDSVMDRRRPPRLGHSPKTPGNEPVVISLNTPWMSGNHTPVREHAEATDYMSSGGGDSNAGNMSLYGQLRNKNLMGASGGRGGVDNSDRASIAGSIHKNLPLAPPEVSAKDRVTMLNAQLSGLAQRRINIGRSIKQMTELMPTDNLLATPDVLSKREMEKRKVENLRSDLAEIQREEYEIGLKLHRAYKRLDKNAEYEPTTLWVRRVTG